MEHDYDNELKRSSITAIHGVQDDDRVYGADEDQILENR